MLSTMNTRYHPSAYVSLNNDDAEDKSSSDFRDYVPFFSSSILTFLCWMNVCLIFTWSDL